MEPVILFTRAYTWRVFDWTGAVSVDALRPKQERFVGLKIESSRSSSTGIASLRHTLLGVFILGAMLSLDAEGVTSDGVLLLASVEVLRLRLGVDGASTLMITLVFFLIFAYFIEGMT